jgi:hypothetical protein
MANQPDQLQRPSKPPDQINVSYQTKYKKSAKHHNHWVTWSTDARLREANDQRRSRPTGMKGSWRRGAKLGGPNVSD